jgi:hypothetical protein
MSASHCRRRSGRNGYTSKRIVCVLRLTPRTSESLWPSWFCDKVIGLAIGPKKTLADAARLIHDKHPRRLPVVSAIAAG